MKIVIGNSYCRTQGEIHPDVDYLIRTLLTYKNEIEGERGQLFFQLKLLKKKGESNDPEEQALRRKKYHATMGRIKYLEANEYVCLYKNNTFATGLLNIVLEGLKCLGSKYEIEDLREHPGSTAIIRWNNPPPTSRYYQTNMINLGVEAGRGVFESAVGTGKSLIMANIIKETSVNNLVIVPSRGLSGQLYNDFSSWFGYANVQLLDAEKIRKNPMIRPVNIVTVQSLASLVKTGEFEGFAKKIQGVHGDEIHHSGAASYANLLPYLDHVYYRFGYTGTFLRNDNKTLEMWGFLSNRLYSYPAHQAIAEGFLTPIETHIYKMRGRPNIKYQTEYDNHYCNNPELLQKVTNLCTENGQDQILILVAKKDKCGLIIHEYLKAMGVDNTYISGDNEKEEINNTISAFNDKQVRVLIGSSVIGEGIDVRSADHLIMCQGGKSEITMVQAAGRLVRLYPGKALGYLHDFRFVGSNYMEKHIEDRIDTYIRNFACRVIEHE